MPIEQAIHEMQGKISLLDNRKFIHCVSAIGLYYIAWIGFLMHHILRHGGFH
ncbi:MAG TPA: hypothetical protein VHE54_09550 [Puia sp.]|nr:hypothetical protein [Puia sp.]